MRMPVLRLNAEVLIVPLHAEITDDDVIGFQTDVTAEAAHLESKGVVIDVSALDIIDSYMARVLNDTASMLRLLGAEVVVCGVQPAVALTLVEMGRSLVGVATAFNLESALGRLEALMAGGGVPPPASLGGVHESHP
jgi:rsbT antagonist protein RsbS